jgi:RHS repeat-associated protein
MVPGQTTPVTVTMQNNGTSVWRAANGFKLASQNPPDNTTWGLTRVPLPADVWPGDSATFSFNITAPTAAGTYNFQWQMIEEGVQPFGALTSNVAVNVQAAQSGSIYFIHVDHLNTPRLAANAAGQTVWLWHQGEPFGNNVPDENPSGLGAFDLPLRFAGQRYDAETGLHYNYFRDYNPSLGIYRQSDLIGLRGGLNTYAYAYNNPLSWWDPFGLAPSNSQKCRSLAKKIENIEKDIGKRVGDISINPQGLPLLPPYPGAPNRTSVTGHQKIIDDLRGILARRKKQYQDECCDDCDGGGGSAPATSADMSTATAVGLGAAGAACIAVCILQPELCPLILIGGAAVGAAAK